MLTGVCRIKKTPLLLQGLLLFLFFGSTDKTSLVNFSLFPKEQNISRAHLSSQDQV